VDVTISIDFIANIDDIASITANAYTTNAYAVLRGYTANLVWVRIYQIQNIAQAEMEAFIVVAYK
jgi:hypothetical protein